MGLFLNTLVSKIRWLVKQDEKDYNFPRTIKFI